MALPESVAVLGGGITGLSLALRLGELEIPVLLFEKKCRVGGLAGSLRQNGFSIDVGPHSFFSEDNEIRSFVLRHLLAAPLMHTRHARLMYQGRFLDYPLTSKSLLIDMGLKNGLKAGLSYIKSATFNLRKSSSRPGDEESVRDWAIQNFGEHLYGTFFKPYTEQFWKMNCEELSAATIPSGTKLNLVNAFKSIIANRSTKNGPSLTQRENLPMYYPRAGFGEIADNLSMAAKKSGALIHTNAEVKRLTRKADGAFKLYYRSGPGTKMIECSHIISTIPITQLAAMMSPTCPERVIVSSRNLGYRALIVLGMITSKQKILGCHYLYTLDRPYNRLSEMNQFSPYTSPQNKNILVAEIPASAGNEIWTHSDSELYDRCKNSLSKDGLLGVGEVDDLLMLRSRFAYPIYRRGYQKDLNILLDYLNGIGNIYVIGRTGRYSYMDLDQCMRSAFDFAEKLVFQNN